MKTALPHRTAGWFCLLALGLATAPVLAGDPPLTKEQSLQVRIVSERQGNQTTLFAHLDGCSEATITLKLALDNMKSTPEAPLTVDTAGRPIVELVRLDPVERGQPWKFDYQFDYKLGTRLEEPPPPAVYQLPYLRGRFKVIQGPLGAFSHQKGSQSEHAVDWAMPVGTRIYAAREGVVVAVRSTSNASGTSAAYENSANFVVIKHADGTFAEYQHLKRDGVLVKLGDKVTARQPIALSGSTGYSTQPHLHFNVYYNIDGKQRVSLPARFRIGSRSPEELREGQMY